MIRFLVGQCHVSDSNLSVLRFVRSKIKRRSWRKERVQSLLNLLTGI